MNSDEYEVKAMRTAKDLGDNKLNLIHAAMGLSSDAGEFVDAVKKHTIYGKPLDFTNCIEELGDVLWFVALACKTLGTSMDTVMRANVDKLKLRYPEKYSDERAIDRLDKLRMLDTFQVTVQERPKYLKPAVQMTDTAAYAFNPDHGKEFK